MGGSATRVLLAIFLLGCLAQTAQAADRRFAVIVGYNGSDDPNLAPLAYADDDALRYTELLSHTTLRTRTLVALDDASRALWGDVKTTAPTRAAVLAALNTTQRAMARARAAGDRPVLYFVYTGHGNYDAEGRGYVHLEGGRLTTRDLYHHVIAPSQGDPVILLVDACNAALLVHSRGVERRVAAPTSLRLERYPNVGVILASSTVGEVHEWGKFLAGVFSHEVRSALLGPGDVDADGAVTFAELAAFVNAANQRVTNPTIKLTPYIRPPLDAPNFPVIDHRSASFPARIRVDGKFAGKAHLVDRDLVRVADFHKAPGDVMWLALPRRGPFVLVHGDTEYVVAEGAKGPVSIRELEVRERQVVSARGARSDYFDRTLFSAPYRLTDAENYLSSSYLDDLVVTRLVARPWYENIGAWATMGIGAAGLGVGIGLSAMAVDTSHDAHAAPWADTRDILNARSAQLEAGGYAMLGFGTAALVGGALWFLLDTPVSEERYDPPFEVQIGPTGF
ncbi:MAG: hypothetical protein QF464_08450, partial [Myxococcota bacterium]|nr:hypothetical protein [Myxococcota bacterium]